MIAVCATPATLASDRYKWLKHTYASNLTVLEPDCSQWASMIEDNQINEASIEKLINDVCKKDSDVVVLGCTHYHWIQDLIIRATKGRAMVIQPEEPVVRQLQLVLGQAR